MPEDAVFPIVYTIGENTVGQEIVEHIQLMVGNPQVLVILTGKVREVVIKG